MSTCTTIRTAPEVFLNIAGERRDAGSGGLYEHVNPATGLVDATIPLAGPAEVDQAVRAADKAFDSWRRTKPAERRAILTHFADLIEEHAAEFARLGVLDNGTPITTAAASPAIAAEWTRYYAGWADKIEGNTTASFTADGELGLTLRQPYGVIGVVVTWNSPLISLAMKVPAALAAGNTVVVKPSELSPFCCGLYAELAQRAGIPDGVLSVVPGGAAAGATLVGHRSVAKVSFTGGPATAQRILTDCAATMKPAVLELGGKSANIVFADADLDSVCLHGTFMSIGLLSGQGCAFPTRMIVAESIYDEVCQRVVNIAGNLAVGDPFDPQVASGPLITEAALRRVRGTVERAQATGARLLTGGQRLGGDLTDGFFFAPTAFADVDPVSELAQQEVFGPVLAIMPFRDEDEAVSIANNTRYGLSGYIQTRDLNRALRVAEELQTGEVLINGGSNVAVWRPFGGLGMSGQGKEGGRAGIEEFLRLKGVGVGTTAALPFG
ncbi:aldehyde dehydrogenase family protein [Mycobacterium szulgai]|uniref:Putative succinate-semialdehyde dehydrogenase [NADP(+)] 2 n=1 Tax=Mycobacterium szulgai TaxID=1787 RepID=A0A1X2E292_MYCSZ|nr:aldehyde dehydrogenase family protein [Mycobacterium szulgai]MCV7074835.1 aldehyde dehydrogenase [Mycobacterium szulgai]ORW94501.1 aldehyde dehydrogenase [Mycobacterium szulgai]